MTKRERGSLQAAHLRLQTTTKLGLIQAETGCFRGLRATAECEPCCAATVAGSEIAGEAAAGLAAAYIVLGANKYAPTATLSSYLTHAEQLYTLATKFPGSYQTLTSDPCLKQLGVCLDSHTRPRAGWSILITRCFGSRERPLACRW